MLEKFFKIGERGTSVRQEVIAGITTFVTMAYILILCPNLMSIAGVPSEAVFVGTALAAAFGSCVMAFSANYPFGLAPGVGSIAFFVFSICIGMKIDYKVALLAVFVEGIIFVLMSFGKIRSAIFNAIPISMKHAISVGLGLFIAFIGFANAKLIVDSPATLVQLQNFSENFNSVGIGGIICIVGIFIIGALMYKNVPGAMLIGMLISWCITMVLEIAGIYVPNPEVGMFSSLPSLAQGINFMPFFNTVGDVFNADISTVGWGTFIVITLSFLFVDTFDTLGTIIGVASKAKLLDEDGQMEDLEPALLSDAAATTVGAVMGVPTTTTYVESAAGVAAGGRTGLTALVIAGLFLVSLVFMPFFQAIPGFVTSSALIVVGFFMLESVKEINLEDPSEGIPAFLCLIIMPLSYSIADGIGCGLLAYTAINYLSGSEGMKKVSIITLVLSILYICKFIFL